MPNIIRSLFFRSKCSNPLLLIRASEISLAASSVNLVLFSCKALKCDTLLSAHATLITPPEFKLLLPIARFSSIGALVISEAITSPVSSVSKLLLKLSDFRAKGCVKL